MSIELLFLSAIVAMTAAVAIIWPRTLLQYPVAAALVMWFFILPQAWLIESSGEFGQYQPTLAWTYMILCVLATGGGFLLGKSRAGHLEISSLANFEAEYDTGKLTLGALALVVMGSAAVLMIYRTVGTMAPGSAWTGPIAFYAFAASLLTFGATLGWLLYLYTGSKRALALAVIGLAINLPPILFSARREMAFQLAAIFLLGLLFVKNKSVSRLVLIPMVLFGSIFINQAGAIRSFIQVHDSTLIEAMTSDEINSLNVLGTSETASGVSDIFIANWTGEYTFVAPFYNQIIQNYVPKFILGGDFKENLKMKIKDNSQNIERFERGGATRTGFSDSFQSLHFFGWIIFFVISFYMGKLWSRSVRGDISAQLYYMVLISGGLKVVTESTAVFITAIPLMILSLGSVFAYARQRKSDAILVDLRDHISAASITPKVDREFNVF